jgi:hypothetical protein
MKAKNYKNIKDYVEKKEDKNILKGTIICKAKKCDKYLYKNYSSFNREYCSDCL